MQSIYDQIIAFIVTIGIGFLAGILFDVYRVIRGLWQPRRIGTYIGDVLFWLIMTCLVFILLLFGNWAELRVYVFIGIFLGCFLYMKYYSKKGQKIFKRLFTLILKFLKILQIGLTWPFRIVYKVFLIPVGLIASVFVGTSKRIKKITKKIKEKIKRFMGRKPKG